MYILGDRWLPVTLQEGRTSELYTGKSFNKSTHKSCNPSATQVERVLMKLEVRFKPNSYLFLREILFKNVLFVF